MSIPSPSAFLFRPTSLLRQQDSYDLTQIHQHVLQKSNDGTQRPSVYDRLTTEIRHIFDFVTALGIYLRKEGNVCLNWIELKKLSQWRREKRRWSSRIVLHFSLYFSGIDPTDVSFFLLLILDLQRRQPQSRERYVQDCTQALRLVYSTE